MKKNPISLQISKAQLELLCVATKAKCSSWQRTLNYLKNGDAEEGIIEECSKISEAEYMLDTYSSLQEDLKLQMSKSFENITPLNDPTS